MGLIGRVIGAGGAVKSAGEAVGGVAEVFVGNRAAREAAEFARTTAALEQHGAEFKLPRQSRFDRFMDGLNRLPRPLLVIGTLGLFVYAMAAPAGFALRMEGLGLVPAPLWWLLGAIVSFYFGARELHYHRDAATTLPGILRRGVIAAPSDAESEAAGGAQATQATPAAVQDGAQAPQQRPAQPSATAPAAPLAGRARTKAGARAADPDFNAAVEEWLQKRG